MSDWNFLSPQSPGSGGLEVLDVIALELLKPMLARCVTAEEFEYQTKTAYERAAVVMRVRNG